MKSIILTTIAIVSLFAYACTHSSANENFAAGANEIPVQLQKLETDEVSTQIQTSGHFTTNNETTLSFKIGGVIEKVLVKEGDAIRKGQLLASLNLTEVNAQLAQAELALEKSRRDFERISNLYRDSVATLEQFQNSKTGLDIAKKQLETIQFNRRYSELIALEDGYVLKKSANEGEVTAPGAEVLQTNNTRGADWVLKVSMSDREWSSAKLGDNAIVSIDALPGETFAAKLVSKSNGTDESSGTFTAELKLTGKLPTAMASGLFGKAVITPTSKQKVWTIPYDALLDGDVQTGFVFVTNDMKTVQKQKVTIATIDKGKVIISSGLENVVFLVTTGSAYLRDNSLIRPINN